MKTELAQQDITRIEADAVVVGVYEEGELSQAAAALNEATGGVIGRLIENEDIEGKPNQLLPLYAPSGMAARLVMLVGLGEKDEFEAEAAFKALGAAAKELATKQRSSVVYCLDPGLSGPVVHAAVAGVVGGCHGQDLYRAEKKRFPPETQQFVGVQKNDLDVGTTLGESVNFTRRLVNEPPQAIYPETFAAAVQEMAAATGLTCQVWDQTKLEEEKCDSLLAVARGSVRPPRLVILQHRGGAADAPTLALAGKGVTFDSGGLSIKTGDHLLNMKCDMAGAATVAGAMRAIARLQLPVNVVGLAGLVENMPGGNSFKVDDVLTARSGKTIEVQNTDAEGRLVLADVLNVALDYKPEAIVDLATLTGACLVALGKDVAGLMSNDEDWCSEVKMAAGIAGEQAWPLPMFPEYGEQIKSEVADIKNMGEGRFAGAITAAKFLEEFVEDTPWTHIDIAGAAFGDKPKPWIDGGGTGAFVRTLVELARRWEERS